MLLCSQTVEPGHYLLTSLFKSLATLPAIGQLRYTVCLTIGAYSLWLVDTVKGTGDNSLLGELLGVLTSGRCLNRQMPMSLAKWDPLFGICPILAVPSVVFTASVGTVGPDRLHCCY